MASNVTDYAKEKAKKVATHFLTKLMDSFEPEKETGNHSGKPSVESPSSSYQGPPTQPAQPDFTSEFNNLSISSNTNSPSPSTSSGFIGGFHPQYIADPSPYASQSATIAHTSYSQQPSPNYSRPQGMPNPQEEPQSSIMQMALKPDKPQTPWKLPHSNTSPENHGNSSDTLSPPKPTKSTKPASAPTTPTKTPRPSTGRTPSKGKQVQCAGVTKAGKQCTRMVKLDDNEDGFDSDDEDTEITKFCHQHSQEVLGGNSGFYARKNGEWVKFDDWIPSYLQPETQVALRVEMDRSRTQSDVPGYIYTFEIREETDTDTIKLKVGRAVNLVKRIDQWGKQCGSKEQVLRGFYPGSVEPDEGANESLLKGRVKAGEKGPWCHRLERLVHLELGDLVRTCIYLDPKWPKVEFEESDAKNSGSKGAPIHGPCADCGSMHKEIFEFQRWKKGVHKGKEWQELVKPVIERWGRFVELYV